MDARVSGFEARGSWADVVDHGDRFTRALRAALDEMREGEEVEVNGGLHEALDEWDAWRPRPGDDFAGDMNRKTSRQASVGEGPGEAAGKEAGDDLKDAGRKLGDSVRELDNGDLGRAREAAGEGADRVARAAGTAGRKAVRSVERAVYEKVMTRLSPYYFDNDLISANLRREGRGDDAVYVLEVDVLRAGLKERVAERIDGADAAEGAEAADGADAAD